MGKAAGATTWQSSGIPNFTSFPDYTKLEPFATTTEQLVARCRDKPLDFTPGDAWSYCNTGGAAFHPDDKLPVVVMASVNGNAPGEISNGCRPSATACGSLFP